MLLLQKICPWDMDTRKDMLSKHGYSYYKLKGGPGAPEKGVTFGCMRPMGPRVPVEGC
jgi:hypothetical protein